MAVDRERLKAAYDAAKQAYQFSPNAWTFAAFHEIGMVHAGIEALILEAETLRKQSRTA